MRPRHILWLLLPVLIVLHQDYWQWSDATLWFGFLPQTLFYHALLTLAAATFWLIAVFLLWPSDLDGGAAEKVDGPRPPAPDTLAEASAETLSEPREEVPA